MKSKSGQEITECVDSNKKALQLKKERPKKHLSTKGFVSYGIRIWHTQPYCVGFSYSIVDIAKIIQERNALTRQINGMSKLKSSI